MTPALREALDTLQSRPMANAFKTQNQYLAYLAALQILAAAVDAGVREPERVTTWLIERDISGATHWLVWRGHSAREWTTDAHAADRHDRIEATRTARDLKKFQSLDCQAVEHVFVDRHADAGAQARAQAIEECAQWLADRAKDHERIAIDRIAADRTDEIALTHKSMSDTYHYAAEHIRALLTSPEGRRDG